MGSKFCKISEVNKENQTVWCVCVWCVCASHPDEEVFSVWNPSVLIRETGGSFRALASLPPSLPSTGSLITLMCLGKGLFSPEPVLR